MLHAWNYQPPPLLVLSDRRLHPSKNLPVIVHQPLGLAKSLIAMKLTHFTDARNKHNMLIICTLGFDHTTLYGPLAPISIVHIHTHIHIKHK